MTEGMGIGNLQTCVDHPGGLARTQERFPRRGPPKDGMGTDRCPVCSSPARTQAETLLTAGGSYRGVARVTRLNRASLARHHREHVQPASRRLAVVPGMPESAHTAAVDPMREALKLLERAKTKREKLKAAQAVRRASWLALRSLGGEPDEDLLQQLDSNVATAAALFREQQGFESALAGLEGVRDSIRARLTATQRSEEVKTSMTVAMADGAPTGDPIPYTISLAEHFRGVPAGYKVRNLYAVQRVIRLKWPNSPIADERPDEEIRVDEIATNALVWGSRS